MSRLRLVAALLAGLTAAPAQQPPQAYVEAVKLHQAGRLEEAAKAYRAYLETDPSRPEALSNLGAVLVALGRNDEAITAYDRALLAAPGHPGIRRNRTLALYKSGRMLEAAQGFASLRAEQPDDLTLALLEADCRFRVGDEQAVIGILEPLTASNEDNLALSYLLGSALIRNDRVEAGEKLIARVLSQGDTAEARLLIGLAHVQGGAMEEALIELQKATAINPNLPMAQSHLGKTLLQLGRREEAAEAFRKELANNPTDFDASLFLGVMRREDGAPDEALPHLEKAQALRPQALEVTYQIALAQMALERYDDAERTLTQLLELAPEFSEGHVSLATVYYRLGRKQDALRHREIARELAH